MRKCRFCGITVDANLVDSKWGIECDDEDLCLERVKASIEIEEGSEEEQLVKEGLMTEEEHIREVFLGEWYEAAQARDMGVLRRILVLVRPKKWELKDR